MVFLPFPKSAPFGLRCLGILAVFFLLINLAVRISLQIGFPASLPLAPGMVSGLAKGFLNDCAALVFVLLLPAALTLTPTERFFRRTPGKIYAFLLLYSFAAVFIFTAFAEYFFWDEFSARFNFIAVDYLIYTTELVRNIMESYPMAGLLSAVFVLAGASAALMWRSLRKSLLPLPGLPAGPYGGVPYSSATRRLGLFGLCCAAAALCFFFFTPLAGDQNRFWNEYAKNGVYEFFSAYLRNQLDYRAFYKTMDRREAFALAQNEIREDGSAGWPAQGEGLLRLLAPRSPEKRPNVVIVIMESMGSKGAGENTPNLNSLAGKGLSFSNMMSTGTRTVRGLEAIMLSVPPTPGNSIVRRPDNDKLFNLGTPFQARGYDRDFIYGGYGYFDNMNAFFAGNGYRVTDRLDFADQSKTFANAWGQCDEDLYAESLRLADRSFAAGKPFMQVLLTTSNHRPFTYPAGKIGLEQGSRKAAIQYADFAVGEFIRQAQGKAWFDNTAFVFVGDHPAAIAGKTEIPADAYGIVCLMYGPKFFRPEKVETLCSQIDVAPTLLAGLDWGYASQFFGSDARKIPPQDGRAWISTYQLLGFRTNDKLVVLKPDGSAELSRLNLAQAQGEEDDALIARSVAFYQCAYDLFAGGQMKESAVIARLPK